MRLCIIASFCATAIAFAPFLAEASAQVHLTQVEGSHLQCADADLHPCLTLLEQELIHQHPEILQRASAGLLSARLKDGRRLPISDGEAMDLLQDGRYLALIEFGEEDIFWRVLDLHTGKFTRMEGYPLFSTDGQHMVSAEFDEMNSNFLDIYDVTDTALVRVHRAVNTDARWWPDHICWIDNRTVGYMRTTYDNGKAGTGIVETPEALFLTDGKWRIEHSSARCARIS